MSKSPKILSQFYHELKRRGVIKTIAMYAGGAYVLIELSNNVAVPLNLPDWTPKLVILIALIGFPIIVILSWIFDITLVGINKTHSIEEADQQERNLPPVKRRLNVSDIIIVVLIVLVGILAYPRIFGSGNLNAMTVPVTVLNEYGERETRRVFKEDYLTKVALFPFNNESKDSMVDWMGWGILEAVLEDQHQFSNMLIASDDAVRLNEQIEFAKEGKFPYFLTGTFQADGNTYQIISRLYQTSNGSVRNEHIYIGTNLFVLIDSICMQVRSDLGISEVILNATPDLPISDLMTDNLEAYENYIQGRYYWHFENVPIYPLNRAIQIDSTFAKACYRYAYWCYNYQLGDENSIRKINQALRHRQRLSEFSDMETRILYYLIFGDKTKVVELTEYQYELRPRDLNLLSWLYSTYLRLNLYERAEEIALKMNELGSNHPPYQIELADCYLLSGKPDKSVEVLDEVLRENPENVEALLKIGEAYLHVKDLNAAEEAFKRAIYLMPEQETHWTKLLDIISFARNHEINEEFLKSYGNRIRNENRAFTNELSIIQNQLFLKGNNQRGLFIYPVSDTVFVSAFKDGDTYNFLENKWFFSSSGKPIRVTGEQWDGPSHYLLPAWIEDFIILDAKDLLAAGRTKEALDKFREAYAQNPEHYYLANYIRHLECILGPDHDTLKSVFKTYVGYYGDLRFHTEDDRLFCIDYEGLIFELLPLTEDMFMVPDKYELQVQIVKEKGKVSGLKYIHRDGRVEYFQRTTTET
jgi:tetratricopeptide (TPR) repeat protein